MSNGWIRLRAGREKPVRNQHPWIFSGAIAHAEDALPGDIVTVQSGKGEFLGRGYWNAQSQIQVRMLTWRDEVIDADWWLRSIERAIRARMTIDGTLPQACRLIHAESDYLPGLVVDRYGDYLVLQALTLHIDQNKVQIAEWLVSVLGELGLSVRGIYERSDVDVRAKEGLAEVSGLLWGEEPPALAPVKIDGLTYLVDIYHGHKTGAYLDQLSNWRMLNGWIQDYVPDGFRMLNLFSYSGAFALAAGAARPASEIVNVDSSQSALDLAQRIVQQNDDHLDVSRFDYVNANVFDKLRDAALHGQSFDVVVLDPPKFAHNKGQVEKAARGYKDLNLNAFKLVRPGGFLLTFSCSGSVSRDLFQKIVFGALADSGRTAQIIRHLSAGDDHPSALTFPEGDYLKGLLLRVY